jgi:hypothetical protein
MTKSLHRLSDASIVPASRPARFGPPDTDVKVQFLMCCGWWVTLLDVFGRIKEIRVQGIICSGICLKEKCNEREHSP